QQKMFTPPPTDEQQEITQRMMKIMMIFMGFLFFKVASGLCIYFIASSLWSVGERVMLKRLYPNSTSPTPPPAAGGDEGGAKKPFWSPRTPSNGEDADGRGGRPKGRKQRGRK